MTRLLVFADLHVGKGMSYADDRLGDYRDTLDQIALLAEAREVDGVLFAGDMFEGPLVPSSHYTLVRDSLIQPLAEAEIGVTAISGNGRHDSAASQGAHNALAVLDDIVHFFTATTPLYSTVGVPPVATVACLPWVSPSQLRAREGTAADAAIPGLLVDIAEDLRDGARRFRPDLPCILMGHWGTTGWELSTGLPTDVLREPLFPIDELERLAFDAAFFGHIHRGGQIAPGVWSVGSPLPLDFGEGDDDHGCWIWEDGVAEFVPLDYRPFVTLDARTVTEDGGVVTENTDLRGAVVRVRYTATEEQARRIDHALIQRQLLAAGAHRVWQITPTIERPSRARVEGMAALHPFEAIDAWIEASKREVPLGLRERGREILKEAAA